MTREQWDELFLKVGTMQLDELEKIIVDSARKADVLQTNADRIRAMSDEELAMFLGDVQKYNVVCKPIICEDCADCMTDLCWQCWRAWLKAPVEVQE